MSIKQQLQQQGVTSEQLDEITHEAASQLASNANNDGMGNQIDFLTVVCGWSDEEILQAVAERS